MVRMRTAEKVLEIIKAEDPDTAVTLHYVRRIIKSGAVPCVTLGRKKLVDADAVIAYIAKGDPQPIAEEVPPRGKIRPVAV